MRFGSRKLVIAVNGIQDAQAKWNAIRDHRGLGASQSPRVSVVDTFTGKQVAEISYNGRAWDTEGKEIVCAF